MPNICLAKFSRHSIYFYTLLFLLFISFAQSIYALFVSDFILFDDIEHLRASYFVANGNVPYRDFFEHHHPLLWYILAPVVKILPHHTMFAVCIGRMISFFISLIGGYYVYKIEKRFFGGTLCALICLNLWFWPIPDISASALFNIKPDIYMRCCFICGFYHLLLYFEKQKFRDLQICTLLFVLSFLFLQTAIFCIFPLFMPVCYFLYNNPLRYKDFLKASVFPLLILIAFAGLLFYNNLLAIYWQTNWVLNSVIGNILHAYPKPKNILLIIDLLILAIFACQYYIRMAKINIYIFSITTIFIFELGLRLFFNTTYIHYLIPLIIYSAILVAPFVYKLIIKSRLLFWTFAIATALHILVNSYLTIYDKKFFNEEYLQKTKGVTITTGFYQQRLSYYWMYPIFEGLDNTLFNRLNDYDINQLYHQALPEILIIDPSSEISTFMLVINALKLTDEQQKVFKKHAVDIKKIGNYTKIIDTIFKRSDIITKEVK